MNTKKSLSLFIIVMFIMYSITAVSFVYFPEDLAMSDKTETEETINNQSLDNFIHFSSLLTEPDTEPDIPSKNTLDTETWYPGETIDVVHSPANLYIPSEYSYNLYFGDPDGSDPLEMIDYGDIAWTFTDSKEKTHNDDSYYWEIEGDWNANAKMLGLEIEFILPIFRTGILEHDIVVKATNTNSDTQSDTQDSTVTIGEEHISADGILVKIRGTGAYSASTSEWVEAELMVFDYATNYWDDWGAVTDWGTHTYNIHIMEIKIYYFKFVPNDITENVESRYKYNAAWITKLHELQFWILESMTSVTVKYPTDWTYSSISPIVSVSDSSSILTITGTIFSQYTLKFVSTCSYHLTIEDKSSTYLQNIGFEDGRYQDDWSTTTQFDTSSYRYFEGYYSLETEGYLANEFFTLDGDVLDFEEDTEEFDIKLNGLDTIQVVSHAGEMKLRLAELTDTGTNYGAQRADLSIDTDEYSYFYTEICMDSTRADRVKITLHFSDTSTQDHVELIANGETIAFKFDITAGKTIEDIDIYFGNDAWSSLAGDQIYVSYIEIYATDTTTTILELTLPLDDYYINFALQSDEATSVQIAELDETISITVLDTWKQYFYYMHDDSFTITFENTITSSIFFDNFKIAQTSTTITTDEPSKSLISSSLHAWDGYQNPVIPYETVYIEFWDRCDQTLEHSYNTTTDIYGIATVEHLVGLEHKEYILKTLCLNSDFVLDTSTYYYDQATEDQDLTDWSNSNVVPTFIESFDSSNTKYGDVSYKVIMDDNNNDGGFQYTNDNSIELNDYDKICFWMESNVSHSGTGDMYVWTSAGWSEGGLTSANTLVFYTEWTFYSFDLRDYFTITNASVFDDAMTFRFDVDYEPPITVYIDDIHFLHAVKLYFTPSEPHHIDDYAETELLDAWDWTEGDFEINYDSSATENETVENGYYFAQSDTAVYNALLFSDIDLDVTIDCSYYTHLLFRAKMDDWVDGGNRWEFTVYDGATPYDTEFYYTEYISPTDSNYGEWVTWLVDLRTTTNFRAGYQWGVDFTTLDKLQIYHTGAQAHEMTEDLWIDYVAFVHIDSFLEETNDYATDVLHDTWDFEEGDKEEWDNGNGLTVQDGYAHYTGVSLIKVRSLFDADTTYYTRITFKYRTNQSNWYLYARMSGPTYEYDYIDSLVSDENWHVFTHEFITSFKGDMERLAIRTDETNNYIDIDYIYLTYPEELPYTTIQNNAGLESETNDLLYNVWVDFQYFGVYTDLSLVPLCGYSGQHYLQIQPFKQDDCYITQNIYTYYYSVSESGIMKIIIHDQSGNVMNFDQFKVYVEGYRLYDNYMYFTDTSTSFNLTINDLFDNQMYTNSSEVFEEFKQIQLTLFSVKIQNIQENPIYFRIERGGKYYSEWIFTYEVIEYFLEEATYTIWIYYSDVDGEFGVSENGTVVNYNYYIDDDTAIRVTGYSIEDVWGNVVNLIDNLDAVNASLTNQIIEVDIHIENINTSITNQVVDVEIYLTNVNTSLGSQILSIQTDLINLNTTLFTQTVSILTEIANVNTTLFDQTVLLLTDIANVNTTLYTQTLTILSDLTNINSTIFSQTVSILTLIENVNTTLFEQTLTVIAGISNMNSTLFAQTIEILTVIENINSTLFIQTVEILNQISNVNTTLYAQTVSILTEISNINATLFDQTVLLLTDLANVNTTLYSQTLTILSDITNINSTIFSQTVSILTLIENVNSTLFEQTLTVIAGISNMNSTIFAQTIQILTVIENINSTLFIQTVEILNQISNINTTLYVQTIAILTELDLHNDTVVMYVLHNQQLLAELQIYNTMYHTTYFTLTTITGVGLDFITAAVYINNTRIYDSKQIYYNGTYLEIEVRDYFGNLLYSYSCRITSDIDLNLPINLILQTFENPYDVAIEISLSNIHNDTTIISWIIPPHSTISVYILASSYDITITPLAASFTNTTHTIYYEPQTIKFQDLGSKQTYSVECITSAKALPGFVSSEEQLKQAKTLLLLSLLLNAFMLALASMLIKWGAIKVLNFILLPFMYMLRLTIGFTPKVLVRDAGGLRFVNLDQYEELKKRTEKGMI